MADYTQYHALGQGMGVDPNDRRSNIPQPSAQSPYPQQAAGYFGGHPSQTAYAATPQPTDPAQLTSQMGALTVEGEGHASVKKKRRDRHAHHTVEVTGSSQAFNGMPPPGATNSQFLPAATTPLGPGLSGQFGVGHGSSAGTNPNQFPAPAGASYFQNGPPPPSNPAAGPEPADTTATIVPTGHTKLSADGLPSVPVSRDSLRQYFLENLYPTFERHVPPPATVSFVAYDQGNASPKFARLSMNNVPATADGLQATGLPLGLLVQPLAPLQPGELEIPVLDFGEAGPPRCRRCRAYINPFMMFRSGGNKFVCNLCTHPNDTSSEYFCATSPQGIRIDRDQRPELHRGTVEFVVPKEYWTREPVGLRWLFIIDATMESYNKAFMETFCEGILAALYGRGGAKEGEEADGETKRTIPAGAKVGFITYDKDVHFYSINMMIMPDLEEPFVPLDEGLFVDPYECETLITSLLTRLPEMFSTVKNPEPALLATLNAALAALEKTGGKMVCSCSALPTWGPGRLFMRDDGNHVGDEMDKKLYTTEHAGWKRVAEKMASNGVGVDFFLVAPAGGYLDIATIGHVSATTGGETFYYPNFIAPRDSPKLSAEIAHTVERETGFQALMKVRCSNGLQIANYHGAFLQHTFGADLEMGVVDADKAIAVSFSYDGKLDAKLDVHFQSALLYTTASGQRRVRCSNIIASVSETAKEAGAREQSLRNCMKFVDQDAVLALLAKEATTKLATTSSSLKDVRNWLAERAIDIIACYRRHSAQHHPAGQLVMPERLKEFCIYMLGLVKCRAFKAGIEHSDRRIYEVRLVRSMGATELSLYLYPRIVALHNLQPDEGFADPATGHLKLPPSVRASFACVEPGGVYLADNGQQCLLWLHQQTSPNLLADLFGDAKDSLQGLDAYLSALPVLDTHLNCQVRNLVEFFKSTRAFSKGLTLQLARQGIDGAEYEFARLLVEDRNEAQSYVDWLVHVHRGVQLELSGQRKKESESEAAQTLANFTGLRPAYW